MNPQTDNKNGQVWRDRWNDRYSKQEFAYGKQPNKYLKEQLDKLKPGAILFPAAIRSLYHKTLDKYLRKGGGNYF